MKKIAQYIPLRMCLFLVVGILVGYYIPIPDTFLFLTIITCIILLILFFRINKTHYEFQWVFQLLSYLIIILVGIARISSEDISKQKRHYSHYISKENYLVYQVDKALKSNIYYDKYYGKVMRIDSTNCKGKILINIAKDSLQEKLKAGTLYYTKSSLREINRPLNPYTFNYNSYMKKQGVFHQISLKKASTLPLELQATNLKIIAALIRVKIQNSLQNHSFKKNELGIINALVLGQRQSISKDLLDSYAGAGAIHILAVSGLHVGILFLIVSFLLKPLEKIRHGAHVKMAFIVLFLWGFALLTGLSGSVVRAVSMFTFIAIGLTFKNQKSAVLHALITSFFFLVLLHPYYIFDVGFQMSYTAVIGIILFFPKINALLPRIKLLFPRKIWELLCVSLSATIGTLPISLYYFHQFPGLFFLTNIIIVPFLGLIMSLGILVVLLSLLNILPELLVDVYSAILSFMNTMVEWIASQEQFPIKDIPYSLLLLIGSYFAIAMAYRFSIEKKIHTFQSLLFSILILQSIFLYEQHQTDTKDELVIFHKTKGSLIGVKNNRNLFVFHSFDSVDNKKIPFIKNYKVGSKIKDLQYESGLPNVLQYNNKKMLIIDSLGIYKNMSFTPDIILLRNSPKINLSRLIVLHNPNTIIADGSNYKNLTKSWRKTCLKHNIAFHYTGSNGAYTIKAKN